MKYISMKMEPKGSSPTAGITNTGSEYQAGTGMGLKEEWITMLFNR
jgi:hypothetical protein